MKRAPVRVPGRRVRKPKKRQLDQPENDAPTNEFDDVEDWMASSPTSDKGDST